MAKSTTTDESVKIPAKLNRRLPDFHLFRLTRKVSYLYDGQSAHGGAFTIPAEDNILWAYHDSVDGQEEKPFSVDETAPEGHDNYQVRRTRYIPNINTIFVDEQKGVKEREDGQRHAILDNIQIREKLTFSRGEIRCKSSEKNLYNFLRFNTQSSVNHPNFKRIKNIDPIFMEENFGYQDEQKVKKGQVRERAYELAHTARVEELIPHAKFLGIPLVDMAGIERDIEAVRTDYKDYALTNSDTFINSFSDPKIKTLYIIKILSESGNLTIESGSALWSKTRAFISQIPSDQDPFDFLASFSLTQDGETFSNNLRGVYNDYKSKNKHNTTLI
jgi:hypothetical protein